MRSSLAVLTPGSELCSCLAGCNSAHLPEIVLDSTFEFVAGTNATNAFLAVNRQWFNAAICHACAFRTSVGVWRNYTCQLLEKELVEPVEEPPFGNQAGSIRVAIEHAEKELNLTKISARLLKQVTTEFLQHAGRLRSMLKWIHALLSARPPRESATPIRDVYIQREINEFRSRAEQLCSVVLDLLVRLPDPGIPVRWAAWFEEMGKLYGIPEEDCARYRSQREQVALLWTNNRQAFAGACEQLEPLVRAFCMLLHMRDEVFDGLESRSGICEQP